MINEKQNKSGKRRTTRIKTNLSRLSSNYKTNPIGLKSDYGRIALTRTLTKIIACLYENEYLTKIDFKNKYGLVYYQLNDGLNWLVNNKIVLSSKSTKKWRGVTILRYYLNPVWINLKYGGKK